MSRNYTIADVLAYIDIPLPEEDDLSDDDDFDGYIDGEIEDEDGNGDDGNGNDSDGHDSESGGDGQDGENGGDGQDSDHGGVEVPEYLGHPGCTQDMANKI